MSLVIMEGTFTGELAYDLRQRYAKIVGDHLEDIAEYRKSRDYPEYFRSLEDLYTIIKHKFKTKKSKKEVKENKGKKETYENLKKEAVKIANDNLPAWTGVSKDPEEVGKIEASLRKIEMFLYYKMNEANMFGSKREQDHLI